MSLPANVVEGLFSGPENVFWILFGIGLTQVWQWVKCKYYNWKHPEEHHEAGKVDWFWVAAAVIFFVMIAIGIQNQHTYSFATQLAQDTKACQIEFNQALKARAQITTENDELSQEQREVVFHWMHDLIFPPAPYDKMSTDDPRRQQWGIDRTIGASKRFQASIDRQEEIQKKREAHPLPDPTCGRG